MEGKGSEFSFTKKRFQRLILLDYNNDYEASIFARGKIRSKAGTEMLPHVVKEVALPVKNG